MKLVPASADDLAKIFAALVATSMPLALATAACTSSTASGDCHTGGGPQPAAPVTVAYSPPTCTSTSDDASTSEADASDASKANDDAGASCTETPFEMCSRLCPSGYNACDRGDADASTVVCRQLLACGRKFAGLRACAEPDASPLGALFARSAHLEAASIVSFEILERVLREHDAPTHLVRGARRSAREESRHARAMTALAHRHGAKVPPVRGRARTARTLAAIARENAIEGCVRETFGALLATYQATHAACPIIREAMRRIARDETRHAALAWQIDGWVRERITPNERRAIDRARRRALAKLSAEIAIEPHPRIVRDAGFPGSRASQALFAGLARVLAPSCG